MIEKMKFLSITGPKTDLDRVVNTYLTRYEIHLENALSQLTEVEQLSPFMEINPYKEALSRVNSLYEELENQPTAQKPMEIREALAFIDEIQGQSEEIAAQRASLEEENTRIREDLELIRPFRNVDSRISDIVKFQYIHACFGRIDKEYFEKFKKYIYENLETIFVKCEEDERFIWGIYFAPAHEAEQIGAAYAAMHFERVFIPNRYEGTAREIFEALDTRYQESCAALAANKSGRSALLEKNREKIAAAKEAVSRLSENFDVRKLAACTRGEKENFYILCGWMTEKDAKAFEEEIREDAQIFCMVEENQENISKEPPTKLNNPGIFKPFEMYTKMYGLPSYGEMDPTWFVALTYSFIFGAMFGDVGQGLVLLVGGFLLYKLKRIALAGIISRAGIFSTIFGFLYGSFFGFEEVLPALWLKPMNSMTDVPFIGKLNTVFVASIAFGMGIILLCMIFNIINSHRAHDVEKTWFDTNAVAGLVFYGSVAVVLVLFMTGKTLPGAAVLGIMFGLPLLIMFFKEPLTNLAEKKQELFTEGKGMFVVQGFFEMFEVILSYFSNTLSFVRIGAFAISHAAMMEVVLMLAGAESGSPNWLVVVFGNLFVCGMEGLVVGIQVLRLEYYEFFSRFYRGSGREFRPFQSRESR